MKKIALCVLIIMLTTVFLLTAVSFSAEKFNIDKKIKVDKLPLLKTAAAEEEMVLFSSYRNGSTDIFAYILNKETKPVLTHVPSKIIQITEDEYDNSSPSLSPDGSQIAYTSYRDGVNYIIIMNADGSHQRRLTDSTDISESYPVWSPDGEKLAFVARGRVNIINKDGSDQQQLSDEFHVARKLSWSPDGQKIAFYSAHEGGNQIYTLNVADEPVLTKLTAGGGVDPDWSPDGSKIAYANYVEDESIEIFVMNADTSNKTRLTHNTANKSDMDPCWTGDNKIVFSSYRSGNSDLYIMDADGSNQRRLTTHPGLDRYPEWGKITIED